MPTSPATHLSTPDLGIVVLYLAAITIFGLRFAKSGKQPGNQDRSLKSYFLADNAIPWWAIALSIVSAETSTLTIISIPGVAFAGNLGFLQIVLGYMLGRIVVAFLFLPKYFRGEMLTAYQLIDRRFGHTLHKITAGLFLLTRAAAEGVRVFAISIVVSIAIGAGDIASIAIISALTLLYTFEGGMRAVIWTDVVQMALYVAGTVVALITLGHNIPGGWPQIHAAAAPLGKFQWLDFSWNLTKSYTFWAGILGGTFLTMASHGTDQLMVQRMLAARNLRASRLALLSSGAVIFLQFFLFLLIGVGLFVFYSAHSAIFKTNDYIFPTYIVREMPHGISGLLIAAILAAAMSNLSAALNSLASTTVIDFWLPWRSRISRQCLRSSPESPQQPGAPSSTDGLIVRQGGVSSEARPHSSNSATTVVSRAATIFWAIVLFFIAVYSIHAGGKGHVVETGLSIAAVAYGSLLGVFLLGTLTQYATQTGAIIGMICGFLTNLFLYQATFPRPLIPLSLHIAFTWYVLIGSIATFAIGTLFSLIRPNRKTIATILILSLYSSAIIAQTSRSLRPSSPSARDQQQYDFTQVSTLINEAIAAKKLPGAVVLIGHNNQIVFEQAFGLRKLAGEPGLDGKPSPAELMTLDTIFDMASLTKVIVTTTAILQLYEQRKLDPFLGLDTPVARYLPEFASTTGQQPSTSAQTDRTAIPNEVRNLRSSPGSATSQAATWKSQITIRQLLTHYSGLPEDVSLKDDWGLKAPDKAEGIRRAMASVPYGPPGQTFKYSDINFITLGFLVEVVSGEDLDDYAQQHILDPLQMNHTRYLPPLKACNVKHYELLAYYKLNPGLHHPVLAKEPCTLPDWDFGDWTPNTAPTAHDNEGKPQTNPNYDHLLRGTVHDPTTRRMGGVAGHAGLFSNAEDMSKFCQALLDKLTKNTGPFPLKQSTLQLATSPQAPATAATNATIFTPDGKTTTGVAQRGLGWDLNSAFSRPRGEIFPITTKEHPGSFGHTGFTGTSLWLDPTSNTYVILLANAIHPRGNPPISPLRGAVATAAARALGLDLDPCKQPNTICDPTKLPKEKPGGLSSEAHPSSSEPPQPSSAPFIAPLSHAMSGTTAAPRLTLASFAASPRRPPRSSLPSSASPRTLTGIDVLEQTHFAALKSLSKSKPIRIALLTNQSGLDGEGHRTIDILLHADPQIQLVKLFTPEHGLSGKQDTENLKSETDPTTHLPVISLYGSKPADRHPKPEDLKDLDAVVIDLQDMGVRFWTYESVLGYFLDAAWCSGPNIVVLDRPNPIGGLNVQGNISTAINYNSYTALPVRHGLTYGELARYFDSPKFKPLAGLCTGPMAPTVIPMQNWTRSEFFADTHLPFTPPSPNMKTLNATILYPGIGLIEGTNISVGRGTETPFENIGAPYIDAAELAGYLTARKIPGIAFAPTTLTIAETPEKYPSHGQTIPGIHFTVTDRTALDTPELGIELLAALRHLYPTHFQLDKAAYLLANPETLAALKSGDDPRTIAATWQPALQKFRNDTTPYLLYR